MISHSILDFPKPSVPGSEAAWFWFSLILGGEIKVQGENTGLTLKHRVK